MIKRKLIKSALISLAFAASAANTVFAANFVDINNNYWAYDAIQSLSSMDIISGYKDNSFRPDAPVTRAEFATMMIRALQKENTPINISSSFVDIPNTFWAANNVQKAYKLGYVSGFPNGTFKPYDNVTKVQTIAALSKVLSNKVYDKNQASRIVYRYSDSKNIPDWAVMSVANALENDIVVNYPDPNRFEPNKFVTRAEVAAMLYNVRNVLKLSGRTVANNSNLTVKVTKPYYDKIEISEQNNLESEVMIKDKSAVILGDSVIPAEIKTALDTTTSKVGDKVYLRLNHDIKTKGGIVLIPRASRITGQVTNVVPAKSNQQKVSQITVKLNALITPEGYRYPIHAVIGTEDGTLSSSSTQQLFNLVGSLRQNGLQGGLLNIGSYLAGKGEIQIPINSTIPIKFTSPVTVDTENNRILSK